MYTDGFQQEVNSTIQKIKQEIYNMKTKKTNLEQQLIDVNGHIDGLTYALHHVEDLFDKIKISDVSYST